MHVFIIQSDPLNREISGEGIFSRLSGFSRFSGSLHFLLKIGPLVEINVKLRQREREQRETDRVRERGKEEMET